MKRFTNISIISLALIALFAGAAMANDYDFYDDVPGYQGQATSFKAIQGSSDAPAFDYALQNSIDLKMARSFSEVQITPNECTAADKKIFLASLARTSIITDELGFE